MIYRRINEQFMDDEQFIDDIRNHDYVYDRVCADVCRVIEGERPQMNLSVLPDAYFKFSSNEDFLKFCKNVNLCFEPEYNLNWIDVSNITDFQEAFYCLKFTVDISRWDVSSAESMAYMFQYSSFNGDISKWDVGNVRSFKKMFAYSKFANDLYEWNIREDADVTGMFDYCSDNMDAFFIPDCIRKDPRRWLQAGVR